MNSNKIGMKYFKIQQIVSLLTCILLMLAVAINRDKKIFGVPIIKEETIGNIVQDTNNEWVTSEGFRVISTKQIAKDVMGYGGAVPLNVYFKDNRIVKIEALENSETPGFFNSVIKHGLLTRWNNMSPQEVLGKEVDVVTGATFSSRAIIQSVRIAANYVLQNPQLSKSGGFKFDIKFGIALLVVLCGLIIPLFVKSQKVRIAQLLLNVIVLGFWSGSFISLSLLTNFLSNGINLAIAIIPLLLIFAAFIMPLFGKKNHYCNWICPMGSFQELIGKAIPYKFRISEKSAKYLTYFREGLWFCIMLIMWAGVGFEIMNYEIFSAFLFQSAGWPVIILASVFLILSAIIQRPYCRFVCPTGTLFKLSQQK